MSYQDYITYVIVDYIFMNPPKYPNYKELENIGKQEGVADLANKVKAFLSSFYNMDAGEIRMSLLEIRHAYRSNRKDDSFIKKVT